MCFLPAQLWIWKVFSSFGKVLGFYLNTGTANLKQLQTEMPFGSCSKQHITPAAAQGTLLSVGRHLQDQEGLFPPPGLLLPSPCLRATLPSPRLLLCTDPLSSCVEVCCCSSLNTHPAGLMLMGFFLHTRCSPKLELAEHLHLSNTIIFPPSS